MKTKTMIDLIRRGENTDEQEELSVDELMTLEGGEDKDDNKNCGLGCFTGGVYTPSTETLEDDD
jgi:hypothetical protein